MRNARTEPARCTARTGADRLVSFMKYGLRTFAILVLMLAASFQAVAESGFTETENGARYRDLVTGSGLAAMPGDVATMHFIGRLDQDGSPGTEIYNSRREGRPVSFVIGTDKVMPGWNEGIVGMRPGGRRLLMLPPSLAYGDRAVADVIPANASLIFVIELIELRKRP